MATGILCKDRVIKMQWKLLSNPGTSGWGGVDLYAKGSKVPRGEYVSTNRNTIHNKFIDEEVYGVCNGLHANNLTQTRKAAVQAYLKMSEGPMDVIFD